MRGHRRFLGRLLQPKRIICCCWFVDEKTFTTTNDRIVPRENGENGDMVYDFIYRKQGM
jgi:hypothetical protein